MATFEAEQLLVLVLAESPLQLAWSFPPSALPSLLDINRLEAQSDGCVVILPNATLSPTAQTAKFYNVGDYAVDIHLFGGGFLITLEVGEYYQFTLIDNTTTFGTWITVPYIAGAVNISNFTIASGTNPSLVITNGNVTATAQTVTIEQPVTLLGLSNPEAGTLDDAGILAYDPNAGNPIYISRVLESSDSNVVITNPNGVTGNPSFSLSATLTGLSSVQVGTVTIDNNGIISAGTDIVISTGDISGNLILNGTQIDTSGNTTVGGTLQVNGAFVAPQMPIAWARMTDTTTGEINTITTQDSFNAEVTHKVSGVGGTYTCTMSSPALNTYYGVLLSCGTGSISSPPLLAQVIYSSITIGAFDFIVTDSGGTVITEVPNSLTLTVFSTGA